MASASLNNPVEAGNPVLSIESLPAIIYRDQPVLTTAILASVYGTDSGQLRHNFSYNRRRFVEGKHFFKVEGKEFKELRECVRISNALGADVVGGVRNSDASHFIPKGGRELTLWTARGAARHAKMLDTDKAWDVFELLEENYFNRQPANPTPSGTLSATQQQELKELVQAKVSAYPDAMKRRVFSQVWTRLQRKFKVPRYEELPVAVFGEARDYIIAMQVRGIEAIPLEPNKSIKELPAANPRSIQDYAWFYPALPENPEVWRRLSFKAADAFDRFGKEIDAIKDEAFRPFRERRRSGVSTFFDGAMSPNYALFKIVDEQLRTAYRCIYEALDGLIAAHDLLRKG